MFLETSLVALALLPNFIAFFGDDEIPGTPETLATTFIAFVLNLAFAMSVMGFLIMHISLVIANTTTIEVIYLAFPCCYLVLKQHVQMFASKKTANEKASHIEKMAEDVLNINALCMAFLARSEESRQSHSVYKLALGTLALNDALSNGLPIQKEVNVLHTYLDGIDKDSLLELVLSTLPEETLRHGTDTQPQLNQKFNTLKDTLRHYSLIPPGGGGILTHTFAHVASSLKSNYYSPAYPGYRCSNEYSLFFRNHGQAQFKSNVYVIEHPKMC